MANQSSSFGGSVIGIAGTPVDPASPGGVLISPSEIDCSGMALDDVIKGDGLGGCVIGPAPAGAPEVKPTVYEFSTAGGVPNGGTRYLDFAGVAVTSVPLLLHAAATLKGIAIVVDGAPAGGRTYEARVIADPGGADTLIGAALSLVDPAVDASTRALSAAIGLGVKWGVVLVRTVGAGPSGFSDALVEVEMP